MSSPEHLPMTPAERILSPEGTGGYSGLWETQKELLAGLIIQALINFPNEEPCSFIQDATGISNVTVATGLLALLNDETLIRIGEDENPCIKPNF